MANWKVEEFAKSLRKKHSTSEPNCKQDNCPQFQTCKQVPSQGFLTGRPKARIFFVTDNVTQDESDLRTPACHIAGKIMHEVFIASFIELTALSVPYYVTKTFRAYLEKAKPTVFEANLCFSHFLKELLFHQPEMLCAFGASVFKNLYDHAINKEDLPPKQEQNFQNLRGKTFTMIFEGGFTTKVFVAIAPGTVVAAPASVRFLKEDALHLASHFMPRLKRVLPEPIEIKKITPLETVKDVFDYLDFLRRGLKEKSTVAFDTETEGLNRVWNNKFLTWQFSHVHGEATVFPIEHREKPLFADPVLKKQLAERMNGLINSTPEETNILWFIGHNIKFDLSVLYGLMKIIPKKKGCIPWWCTMLGMHWLDENRKELAGQLSGSPFSLKTLGVEMFNFLFEEESLEKRGDGSLEELRLDQLYTYGGSDTILTKAVARKEQELSVIQPEGAAKLLRKFQKHYYFPASRAVAVMECNGLWVKPEHLGYLQSEDSPIWNRIKEIENDLQTLPEVLDFRKRYKEEIGGKSKNAAEYESLWSFDEEEELPKLDLNKQDQQELFFLDFLQLQPIKFSKKTKKGKLDSGFLENYALPVVYKDTPTIKEKYASVYGVPVRMDDKDGTPIFKDNALKLESEYRKLKKLGTAYLDSMEGFIRNPKGDSIDSRVRASYNLHGTATGRLCVAEGTLIDCVRDVSKAPKGLPIESIKEGDLVYCYDDQLNLRVKKVLWAGKTGFKKVVRIHWLGQGRKHVGYLDVTPEHRVRLIDGSYVQAKDLVVNQSLLALGRSTTSGYGRLHSRDREIREHRLIYREVHGDMPEHVHHIDGNKLNNAVENLQGMTAAAHAAHAAEHMLERAQNPEYVEKRLGYLRMAHLADRNALHGENHGMFKRVTKWQILKSLAYSKGRPVYAVEHSHVTDFATFKKKCSDVGVDLKAVALRYSDYGYLSRGVIAKASRVADIDTGARRLKIGFRKLKTLFEFYGIRRNHIVTKIEYLDVPVNVYDLEVEDEHNFIANEICIHNSGSNPNLQQLPAGKIKLAKEVKNMFQAEPPSMRFPNGTCLIQGDYKTAEVRWAALFSQDKNLISIFSESAKLIEAAINDDSISDGDFAAAGLLADLHRRTASLMFGMPAEKVSKEMRQAAKCLVGSTLLYTSKGVLKIEDLVGDKDDSKWVQMLAGMQVKSRNGIADILAVNHKWVNSTVVIETELGNTLEGDADHPLIVWRDCALTEVTLKDIREGDLLVIPREGGLWAETSPEIAELTPKTFFSETVFCRICDGQFGNLNQHLRVHNLTTDDYKKLNPGTPLQSEAQVEKRLKSLLGSRHHANVPKLPTKMSPALARILGYMVAEGDTQNWIFAASREGSQELLADFQHCVESCFGYQLRYRHYSYSGNSIGRLPSKVGRYLEHVGLEKSYSSTKSVPDIIFRSTREEVINFLRAYFEGDGTVKNNAVVVMSASKKLMTDIQQLLFNLGMVSVLFSEEHTTPVGREVRTYYGLRLRVRDAAVFARTVGFVSANKQTKALAVSDCRSFDGIYGLDALLRRLREKYKTDCRGTYFKIGDEKVKFGTRITTNGLTEITYNWLDKNLYVLAALKAWSEEEGNEVANDINWLYKTKAYLAPVTRKVVKEERQKVYDIEVADSSHTFTAGGVTSKNCITFGLLFGMTVKTLCQRNGWSPEEGEEKMKAYFSAFPDLETYLKEIPKLAKEKGYVETFMGRRRRLDHLFSLNEWKFQTDADRKAMNSSIQGQSSDAGTIGMFTFMQHIFDNNLEDRWLVQNIVHDSCLVQAPLEDVRLILPIMKQCFVADMQKYIEDHWNCNLAIPIEMEFEIGLKYGDLTPWDGRRKSLDALMTSIENQADEMWKSAPVPSVRKPSKALDLVSYER